MTIRHLQESDRSAICEIYKHRAVTENSSQLPYLTNENIAGFFYNPDFYTLVALDNEIAIGHVTLFLTGTVRNKHCASLAIAVHPSHHGKGIGKKLLLAALEQTDNWLNLVRVELEVHADNTAAIKLYEKSGFVKEGTKRAAIYKAGKYQDILLMARLHPGFTD